MSKVEGIEEFEELQEAREVELEAFQPSPRETEADRKNDVRYAHTHIPQVAKTSPYYRPTHEYGSYTGIQST